MASLGSYDVGCLYGGLSLKFGNFSYIHPGDKRRFVFFPIFFNFTQTKIFSQGDVSD
jgi:hypothetical protein